jgi:hypothetical protein
MKSISKAIPTVLDTKLNPDARVMTEFRVQRRVTELHPPFRKLYFRRSVLFKHPFVITSSIAISLIEKGLGHLTTFYQSLEVITD